MLVLLSALLSATVAPGSSLAVACDRPSDGWPNFQANLTATATTGCGDANVATITRVLTPPAPSITRIGTAQVYSSDTSTTLTYALGSSGTNFSYRMFASASSGQVACVASPSIAGRCGSAGRQQEFTFCALHRGSNCTSLLILLCVASVECAVESDIMPYYCQQSRIALFCNLVRLAALLHHTCAPAVLQ